MHRPAGRRQASRSLVLLGIVGTLWWFASAAQQSPLVGGLMFVGWLAVLGIMAWLWGYDSRDPRDWKGRPPGS
jgi:hypothetical protein